ncbi:amidohydrolase family-domain-containing protein [Apiospora marii]|uniref:Amidohydrolase family-domain-containing protein n=1 Tax=Apiospora marii TaxID=335849 RepID=A0ABR1QZS3_9PEZI
MQFKSAPLLLSLVARSWVANAAAITPQDDTAVCGKLADVAQSYKNGALRGDLLLFNGTIHTMDAAETKATVVGIKEGNIVYVGDSVDDARKSFLGSPPTIDLGGRVAVPGLVESHNHIVLMGNRPGYHTPLENAYSVADVQQTFSARATRDAVPPGSFITTIGGFHPNQFRERRLPTLEELDKALPQHPAFISIGFNGPSVTNSLGKAYLESSSPSLAAGPVAISANGTIAAGEENGKALLAVRQQLTFGNRTRGVRDAMAYAAEMGITTHLDQGAFQATGTPADGAAHEDNYAMYDPWLAVYREKRGLVRLRVNYLHQDNETGVPALTQRLRNAFPFFGGDMVRTGGIGEFIADLDEYSGGPVFEAAALATARARWRVEVHSLTATDFQTQIEAFEKVDAELADEGGIRDLRWVVAHVPLITAEYLARLKKLGGGVNLSSWQYLSGSGPSAGPPYRTIVDSGVPAGIGGDGMQIAPMNPWVQAYYAVTGKNALGEQINEGQQISRQEFLRMYTRANQWFLGGPDEPLLGALEVGRLGDVVVLSDDYFAVPDEELRGLSSVLTVVGGAVVHDTGAVAGCAAGL